MHEDSGSTPLETWCGSAGIPTLRKTQEDLEFKASLSHTDTWETSLDYVRPCLKNK